MNALPDVKNPTNSPVTGSRLPAAAVASSPSASRLPARTYLAIPAATVFALALHWFVSRKELPAETEIYFQFLGLVLGTSAVISVIQPFWTALRKWMKEMCPIIAAGVVLLSVGEFVTAGLRLLELSWLNAPPMPYFPSPAGVLLSLVSDRALIFDSTWHSLLLLTEGYLLGVVAGVISGICIGWFPAARYWGMPLMKLVGPIPATALIPLAMVLSPSTKFSAMGLIALAVWFPVTMLTASGISNTRASYLDVARTLGASRSYLIFRVAIPAAMPNIFIGLFMGLSASFLTLVVAETVGVKSGLGWYVSWAQGWAEYGKVYAALVIMSAFFSTIMTVLFKVRDRVLVWQKGTIKW